MSEHQRHKQGAEQTLNRTDILLLEVSRRKRVTEFYTRLMEYSGRYQRLHQHVSPEDAMTLRRTLTAPLGLFETLHLLLDIPEGEKRSWLENAYADIASASPLKTIRLRMEQVEEHAHPTVAELIEFYNSVVELFETLSP
jgi:hypothetical protein